MKLNFNQLVLGINTITVLSLLLGIVSPVILYVSTAIITAAAFAMTLEDLE